MTRQTPTSNKEYFNQKASELENIKQTVNEALKKANAIIDNFPDQQNSFCQPLFKPRGNLKKLQTRMGLSIIENIKESDDSKQDKLHEHISKILQECFNATLSALTEISYKKAMQSKREQILSLTNFLLENRATTTTENYKTILDYALEETSTSGNGTIKHTFLHFCAE